MSASGRLSDVMLERPVGTQVVTLAAVETAAREALPPGAVGVVGAVPDDARETHRARSPDGGEAVMRRATLRIRKAERQMPRRPAGSCGQDHALDADVIYR